MSASGAVRRLWPCNRLTVSTGDKKEAFADCGRSIVASPQFLVFDRIATSAQRTDKDLKEKSAVDFLWVAVFIYRSPSLKFLNILKNDNAR